jgi:hypothetical protein
MRKGHSNLDDKSASQAQREMDAAVADWLKAYRGHERYLSATERLFMAFAHSWGGSHRYLAEAFADYREALLRDAGYSHSQVAEVFPMGKAKNE